MCKDCSETVNRCIIVGAGAAGLFFAAADDGGADGLKLILEKTSRPGQKLLISGSGACNITHGGSIKDFIPHYSAKGKSIRTCLYRHSNQDLMQFMETAGVPLTERQDGKVFPASMRASDVLSALKAKAAQNGYVIRCGSEVTGVACGDPLTVTLADGTVLRTEKLVIATGGASYPATGSDGSFMEILRRDLGIEVTPLKPALTPVYVQQYPYSHLAGISFDDVEATCGGHTLRGPMLLTHRGFSGPVILHLSQFVSHGMQLTINYLPGRNKEEVYRKISADRNGNSKGIANYLAREFSLPKAFAETLCKRPAQKLSEIDHKEIEYIAHLMTEHTHTVSGTGGFREAMVTAGGVALHEVNMKTMSLIKYPNIHVIGEALDINGDTGGYNLQFAYSSARAAI